MGAVDLVLRVHGPLAFGAASAPRPGGAFFHLHRPGFPAPDPLLVRMGLLELDHLVVELRRALVDQLRALVRVDRTLVCCRRSVVLVAD